MVEHRLGSGGMAEIFAARDSRTWNAVALKRCIATPANEQLVYDMFLREARIARSLKHPHIVTTHELIVDADDNPVLVMELLDGATAASIAPRLRRDPDAIAMTLELAGAAALALDYLHGCSDPDSRRAGLLHRDISPDNLFITIDGTVKLIDFGLAKQRHDSRLTRAGVLKGKAAYLAPEQLARGRDLDGRVDQYALATSVYFLLSNVLPFERDSMQATFEAIEAARAPALSRLDHRVSKAMDDVIKRALHKDPTLRYPSSGAFLDALRAAAPASTSSRSALGPRERLAALVQATIDDRLPTLPMTPALVVVARAATAPPVQVPAPELASLSRPMLLPRPTAMTPRDLDDATALVAPLSDDPPPWLAIVMVACALTGVAVFTLARAGDNHTARAASAVPSATTSMGNVAARAPLLMQEPLVITRRMQLIAPRHIEWRIAGELLGHGALEARLADGAVAIEAHDTQRGVTSLMPLAPVVNYASLPRSRVAIRVRPGAEVMLGEQHLGSTPLPDLLLVPGTYRLRLVKGGVEQLHAIEVADQPLELRYRFN